MRVTLEDKLEVYGFEEGLFVFKDSSVGAMFELKYRNISCATDEELNSLHAATCDFLNGLPDGIFLQFVQEIKGGGFGVVKRHGALLSPDSSPLAHRLTGERVESFLKLEEKRKIPSQKLYLLIRKPTKNIYQPKGFRLLWRRQKEVRHHETGLDFELRAFANLALSLQDSLGTLGVEMTKLSQEAAFQLLFDQWNPKFPLQGLNFNSEDIRDELLLSDFVVALNGFAIGSMQHRILSLKLMPDQTYSAMSEKLQELPFGSKLFVSLEVLNQGKEKFSLETQRRIAYALFTGKKGVSDLESEAKLRDIEGLLARQVTGEEKIFRVSVQVILRGEDEATLTTQVEKVLQTFRELSGAEGMLETLASAPLFFEMSLPNAKASERSRRMNTSVLADFLPIFGQWEGHEEPRVILRNRKGSLLGFDPFSPKLNNFNQVISGGSGAGKSFLANLLISQLIKENPRIFILDIGGSYRRICESLGGQYIPLGSHSNIRINPFDRVELGPHVDAQAYSEAFDQKIKFLVSLIELMTKEEGAVGIGKLERSEIEQSVQAVFRENEAPLLSQLRLKLLESSEALLQRMGKILTPWCGESPYGKFVDDKTNLELNRRIVCFDLKGLESQPDLQAVCLFLITDFVWREVQREPGAPKFVIFDECWRLLESDAGSRFIASVFRTFRKYKASAVAISQTMEDFVRSKAATAILPNSSIKWVLKQTGGNLASLKTILSLNSREEKLVESIRSKKGYFSEAFLIAGDDKDVVVIESTPLEYWLSTTDPEDLKVYSEAVFKNTNNLALEILTELSAKYPRGVSGGLAA